MRIRLFAVVVSLVALAIALVVPVIQSGASAQPHLRQLTGMGFPDFHWMVSPSEYRANYAKTTLDGKPNPNHLPIFRLKTDFATSVPEELPAFMYEYNPTNSKEEALAYVMAARDYSFEGNIPAYGGGPVAWDPFGNKVRKWVHIPWLHSPQAFPPNGGTEGFRGLITEINATPYQFHEKQSNQYTIYAITLVNEHASYALWRQWRDPDNPDPRAMDARYMIDGSPGGFPVGTVFAKLLLTSAPTSQVPYLDPPMQWQAYIQESFGSPNRRVGPVNLLQMDIAVRDDNAGETGWFFSTLVYNGEIDDPESRFLNLVPLGIMWGNDPDNRENRVNPFPPKPIKEIVNNDLKEQWIFDDLPLPPQHLGWNSRLCGPADLNTSSCMGCHSAAQYPPARALFPPTAVPGGLNFPPPGGGEDLWMEWFTNLRCGHTLDPETTFSTDFSYQVAISLENFYAAKAARMGGGWADEYQLNKAAIGRGGVATE